MLVTLAVAVAPLAATAHAASPVVVRLGAAQAAIDGNLQLKGRGAEATIHFWNRMGDRIAWTVAVPSPGLYRLRLRYALPPAMQGGLMMVVTGDDKMVARAVPSTDWNDFVTRSIGSVRFRKPGRISVSLSAARVPAGDGGALPDVAWLSLEKIDRSRSVGR